MAEKARHAFGSSESVETALASGVIDTCDILFLDGDTEPKIGWIDKNGVFRLVKNEADLSAVEAELATKAGIEEVEVLGAQIAAKADSAEVDAKMDEVAQSTVNTAKAYTDGKIEAAINEHIVKKYEITSVPAGTLVDYREKEIRVMCPSSTVWNHQSVGASGNANMYYMGFKAYAPEGAVGFKEGDRGVIIDEMFDFAGDFAGTDEHGRNYSICWLALASYDAASDTWTYFGKNSSAEKYIGWDYVVEWYNSSGVVIASDCMRINLSNEECHSVIEPFYIAGIMKEVDAKIAEANSAYEVIEF